MILPGYPFKEVDEQELKFKRLVLSRLSMITKEDMERLNGDTNNPKGKQVLQRTGMGRYRGLRRFGDIINTLGRVRWLSPVRSNPRAFMASFQRGIGRFFNIVGNIYNRIIK